ncbi:DUF58 domain-containing protein [Paenibacillus tritici]|uniref:DUF58 domain-containing protein n=1 Tax=Paenibacillus tritici TaxID=1873425 RepID=UPI001BA59B9C|nr:DUF58 domain-containing protein [Paenibacillus tritici]QUL55588.1 DUF58 domain-containing protein [Paenibacillus tritici]
MTATGGLYLWRGGESLLLLLTAGGMIMCGGLLMQLCGPRRVNVQRKISPDRLSAGDAAVVEVKLTFASRIPLPWMIITDYWSGGSHQELVFPGFRRSFSYSYELLSVPRGVHQLHGCNVAWGDLPGLFTGSCQPDGKQIFKVLPKALYMGGTVPDNGLIPGDRVLPARGKHSSPQAADIRDYTPGDPFSRIHWKSSARKGTLQSRVPEREAGQMNCIVLASSPEDYDVPFGAYVPRSQRAAVIPAFEQAVSAAMGLLLSAERSSSYIQLFSGGWPEGMARHEGLGQLPGRVRDLLTEIAPSGSQSLSRLLEDASKSWIPGMTVSVITGRLEEESARTMARFLVQGVRVELYYVWDQPSPGSQTSGNPVRSPAGAAGTLPEMSRSTRQTPGGMTESGPGDPAASGSRQPSPGTIAGSLMRLGARIHCLNSAAPAQGYKGAENYGLPDTPSSH